MKSPMVLWQPAGVPHIPVALPKPLPSSCDGSTGTPPPRLPNLSVSRKQAVVRRMLETHKETEAKKLPAKVSLAHIGAPRNPLRLRPSKGPLSFSLTLKASFPLGSLASPLGQRRTSEASRQVSQPMLGWQGERHALESPARPPRNMAAGLTHLQNALSLKHGIAHPRNASSS